MISKKWLQAASVAAVLGLGLAACGGDEGGNGDSQNSNSNGSEKKSDESGGEGSEEGGELSGTIQLDGSSTVLPLSEAAAELFMAENPGVQVTVASSGTGGGFEKFCIGETDGSDASRPIKDEESTICGENDINYEEVTVANDALAVLVNPENPVECVTTEQLNQIWGPDSELSSWSEIDGLEPAFDQDLDLYGPGTDSGTFDYFTDVINGEEGAQRTTYNNIGEDDNQGISGVTGSPGGMFYVGFSYYQENQDTVKALEIDGGDGCVAPTAEATQDGSYSPLGRPLFVYFSDTALQRPEVQAFAKFYIENSEAITAASGHIGLTDEQADEAQAKIDSLIGG